jgi:acetyl esterase/lipase
MNRLSLRLAIATALCLRISVVCAGGSLSVLVVGDDRGEGFSALLRERLQAKMIVFGGGDREFGFRYVAVDGAGQAESALRRVAEGEFQAMTLCFEGGHSEVERWCRLADTAAKLGMEILWLGDPQDIVGEAFRRKGICMADYAGFLRSLKKDGDKPRAEYIAEAMAQWWTGIALSNPDVRRVKLWDGEPPLYEPAGPERINSTARIDGVSEPELELFLPPPDGGNAPAVLFFPGGGYSYLGFLRNARELAAALNRHGIAVIGLKYRTKRRPEATLADALRAVRMVRSNAAEWGLDKARIGVAGQSAGAHLVLNVSINFTTADPGAADPVERESGRPDFAATVTVWNFGSNEMPYDIHPGVPPFFVRQARNDSGFPLAEKLVGALRSAGVPLDAGFVESGGHGAFELAPDNPNNGWVDELAAWIKRVEN